MHANGCTPSSLSTTPSTATAPSGSSPRNSATKARTRASSPRAPASTKPPGPTTPTAGAPATCATGSPSASSGSTRIVNQPRRPKPYDSLHDQADNFVDTHRTPVMVGAHPSSSDGWGVDAGADVYRQTRSGRGLPFGQAASLRPALPGRGSVPTQPTLSLARVRAATAPCHGALHAMPRATPASSYQFFQLGSTPIRNRITCKHSSVTISVQLIRLSPQEFEHLSLALWPTAYSHRGISHRSPQDMLLQA